MKRALRIAASTDDAAKSCFDPRCPSCNGLMHLHQPDPFNPLRMLGVCESCHAWTQISVEIDGRLKLTVLPEP